MGLVKHAGEEACLHDAIEKVTTSQTAAHTYNLSWIQSELNAWLLHNTPLELVEQNHAVWGWHTVCAAEQEAAVNQSVTESGIWDIYSPTKCQNIIVALLYWASLYCDH